MIEELQFVPSNPNEKLAGSMSYSNEPIAPITPDVSLGDYASIWHGGFPGEPSLFEELGIHPTDVRTNLITILWPTSRSKPIDNNFIIGVLFFFVFAFFLLFLKKVRFGMVYAIGIFGFLLEYFVFYYMSSGLSSMHLFTALSYCTLPLIPFILIQFIFGFSVIPMVIVSLPFLFWSSYSATRYILPLFEAKVSPQLVFAPMLLFYSYLLLLPIL